MVLLAIAIILLALAFIGMILWMVIGEKKGLKILGCICLGIFSLPLLLFILIPHILQYVEEWADLIYWIKGMHL